MRTITLQPGEQIIIEAAQGTVSEEIPVVETPQNDLGRLIYKVGLISDIHMNVEDTHNSEYRQDLQNALVYFRDIGVDFICCCGDICEYNYEDFEQFNRIYTDYAFAPTAGNLRLHSVLGNHDYLMLYHPFEDYDKQKYASREMIWQVNIAPFHEPESALRFFEYGAKWNDPQYTGRRTIKSKQNYWFAKDVDIFVCMSIDYGESNGQPWDDVSRGWNLLDYNDPYVKRMTEYVADTNYNRTRESAFDYQFYHPEVLCWLWDILEANKDRRVIIPNHLFFPHKAGDGDGHYSHLRVWPHPETDAERNKYYAGSNTLCGLEFWFLDKLNNEYPNAIFAGGHSHRHAKDGITICKNDYPIRKPTGNEVMPLVDDLNTLNGTQYDYRLYQRASETPCGNCGPCISVPSLSKPVDDNGSTMYGGSEGCVMEFYERGVVLNAVVFKRDGEQGYCNEVISKVLL